MNQLVFQTSLRCLYLMAGLVGYLAARSASAQAQLGNLNCTSCHAPFAQQSAWLRPKVGPGLAEVGHRVSAEWMRRFLATPAETFPRTTMPDLLHGMSAEARAETAEALTHYLVSLAPVGFRRVLPDRAAVARGEVLYHQVGCVACHAPINTHIAGVPSSPLPNLTEKWSFDGLRGFLLDPLKFRPSGRMPGMKLTDREASDIAHYLLRETKVPASLEWMEFRGPIRSLGDLDSATPFRTGPTTQFDLNPAGLDGHRPLRISGWLHIETAGDYTFYLSASGASRVAVDGDWLNGEESWDTGAVDEKSKVRLDAGAHQIAVQYAPRGAGPPSLKLEWESADHPREPIPAGRLSSEREPVVATSEFQVDAAKAARGREIYTQLNCAACHRTPASATTASIALSALRLDQGCLADKPSTLSPDYHLDAARRIALRIELQALEKSALSAPTPEQSLSLALATYNCTACHVRDGKGGPRSVLDAYFTSNGTDLGDEGRLPPRLDDVGNKLRPEWLTMVLAEGAAVRPYLNTRMPVFGAANVGGLADLLVNLDRQARPVKSVADEADKQREAGRQLVGADGHSCIVCHRFNRQPAQTMQIIDLTTVTRRLNEDWFREFLLDPERFHPGTRMPAFWPNGISSQPAVLGGDTVRQQAAIWTYLSDGSRAKFPEGLSRQNLELIVGGEAITYRGKLWEAGFRAVAVGYPGSVNVAFDAEEMRLALLWRGRFLDASPHWTVQGMGQIRPLGSEVVVFPHGSPLAILPDANAPWPTEPGKSLGLRFRGYQLGALRRPTLLYASRNLEMEDLFVPLENGKAGFSRVLKFKGPIPDGAYLRLGAGRFTPMDAVSWRYNESLSISVKGPAKAFLRGKTGIQELLVPLSGAESNHQLEVEYVW